jgi:hypothetical protein
MNALGLLYLRALAILLNFKLILALTLTPILASLALVIRPMARPISLVDEGANRYRCHRRTAEKQDRSWREA